MNLSEVMLPLNWYKTPEKHTRSVSPSGVFLVGRRINKSISFHWLYILLRVPFLCFLEYIFCWDSANRRQDDSESTEVYEPHTFWDLIMCCVVFIKDTRSVHASDTPSQWLLSLSVCSVRHQASPWARQDYECKHLYIPGVCWTQSLQSCLTLCDPKDGNPPGSSVHGILQARTLEWAAMPPPGDLPDPGIGSGSPCIAGGFFTNWATREAIYIVNYSSI